MTAIKEQIEAKLKEARIARDEASKNVIGMLKSKILLELKSGSGVEETDKLWQDTLTAYAKQVRKSIPELEKGGERAAGLVSEARFELAFCEQFLPKKLDEAATEALVRELATANNISDVKQIGKLVGLVMKTHKDDVDGDLLRQVAQRVLAG
ncbi:MAG: GatB/YqeY domain-containing protein [Myxococcales bacterium]|nr:GatB/YqeY domain-containing protein [Myxococcales bacterium]